LINPSSAARKAHGTGTGRRVTRSTQTWTKNPSASGITGQALAAGTGPMTANLPFL
jgi:hypothetical protein